MSAYASSSSLSSTMLKVIKKNTISHLFMMLTLLVGGLITNTIQAILFYTIRPINSRLYQHINYYLLYSLHAIIVFLPEWWSNSDFKMYTDTETMKKLGTENVIMIMNHTHDIDWVLGWSAAERCSILGGVKCMVKRIISIMPTLGWAWGFSDFLFLDRDWEKDKSIIEKQCTHLQDHATPTWMHLFPEGTRFTEEKHKASMEFARKQGIPQLRRLLIPRTRGFVQLAKSLKGHYPAIYDVTVAYNISESAPPQFVSILHGEPVVANFYLRRFELSDLPDDDTGLSQWMQQLFREKDALLDSYLTCGSFTETSGFPVLPLLQTKRRLVSLIPFTVWALVTVYCIYRTALVVLAYGVLGVIIAGGIIATVYFGLHTLVNITRADKGSSYGSESSKNK